jgi:hypothetical protein
LRWSYHITSQNPRHDGIVLGLDREARSRPGSRSTAQSAPESDAVSRYVSGRDILSIAADSLDRCDVGGGSTDAAFWTGDTIDRVSLNVAANDISRLAAAFELNNELTKLSGAIASTIFSSAVFRRGLPTGKLLAHPFVVQMNMTTSDQWRKCRTGAFLQWVGFYRNSQDSRFAGDDQRCDSHRGRGSAMLSWLAPSARLVDVLTQHFLHGLKVARPDAKPEIEITGPVVGTVTKALLKDEVASGLIERKELTAVTREGLDIGVTAAGEVNWTDASGAEIPWH